MDNPFKGVPLNMAERLRRAISAHEAVRQGIATHVEKEHAKRQAAYHKQEQDASLAKPLTPPRHA